MNTSRRTQRRYESPLREEQAEQTRARILDAVARVVAETDGQLSIPAVAREARVSVPTVYRHFGTKDELLGALGEHLVRRLSRSELQLPHDAEELRSFLLDLATQYEALGPALEAALKTEPGRQARQAFMPRRLELIEQGLAPFVDGISDGERVLIRNVFLLLTSSAGFRAAKELLGSSNDDIADLVVWVVDRLTQGARTVNTTKRKG